VKEIAREMAAFFASENPQFDTARFLKAAGLHGASAGAIAASADEAVAGWRDELHTPSEAEADRRVRELRKQGLSPRKEVHTMSDTGERFWVVSLPADQPAADEDLDEAARPPKAWMDSCLARQKGNRKIRDAGAVCAEIWRGMGPDGQRRAKRAGTFEDAEVTETPRRTLVPWADDPELGGLSA
jgi:hypothetical protein